LKKLITGNEAVALGALSAGVRTVTGYPGTPSTGALEYLLGQEMPDRHFEWSVNEKVALEIAAGVAWAGHRALCTMKMSGLNVAYDSLISIAYSGCDGGLVIYVADDPGASAGMCEQDSRLFALMADMPMLEPSSVAEAYQLTRFAFELSEKARTPVFVRLVTALSNSSAQVEVDEPAPVSQRAPLLVRDINRYTKAGAAIVMKQHRDLIERLAWAGELISQAGINHLTLSAEPGGLGIIAAGVVSAYLDEAFEIVEDFGARLETLSVLRIAATHPFPEEECRTLLSHCRSILVLEELEPVIERELFIEAQKIGFAGQVFGKLDGTYSRIGEYGLQQVVEGISSALGLFMPGDHFTGYRTAEELAAARPITTCAGCPHRGTYMAIDKAIRKLKLKKNEVMVTGDIGCTILGMNPPFDTIWNEVSMGASVGLAQGYVYAGVETPVIATIGDSTFFHAGIPGLINAIQHQVNMTLIILDNRWTAMTGMQINPGTPHKYQPDSSAEVNIARIITALGVKQFYEIDPYDLKKSAAVIQNALTLSGVKVILARRECAIQSTRRKKNPPVKLVQDKCNGCKFCIMVTGCAALDLRNGMVVVDSQLCDGCGLCVETCNRDALVMEASQ
jgi:indolepyruvate ferredoxin oxidoreductase alpha subunit